MQTLFAAIEFLNPAMLWGLAGLPALYFLLRLTPPPPRIVKFPPFHFLEGLVPRSTTPRRTPWWILLLRMLIALTLILAMAEPVISPEKPLSGTDEGPLRLIIDNDWASAPQWSAIMQEAQNTLTRTVRARRAVTIVTTAPVSKTPEAPPVMSAQEALATVKTLKPHPWDSDLAAIPLAPDFHGTSIWFSNGLRKRGDEHFAKTLSSAGPLILKKLPHNDLALFLKSPTSVGGKPAITLDGPRNAPWAAPVSVQIFGPRGQVLDEKHLAARDITFPMNVVFDDLPESLRPQIRRFEIAGRRGAGGVYLLDSDAGSKNVGIVAPAHNDSQNALTQEPFYLQKALEPFAHITTGTVEDILKAAPALIILPDIGDMPPESLNALDQWVRKGGLLLRFAGPNMTQNDRHIPLTPVSLQEGSRALGGALRWDSPQHIKTFEKTSPLAGLSIPADVTIAQQILPEISEDLPAKTWAALEDGTPLITASALDLGLLVMVHTSAGPAWSNLALSGLYVDLLKRFLKLSSAPMAALSPVKSTGKLPPVRIMDGFGALDAPPPTVQPIDAERFDTTRPSFDHPPGFYGHGGLQKTLNIGDSLPPQTALESLPSVTSIEPYGAHTPERLLFPALITAALTLFLLDMVVLFFVIARRRSRRGNPEKSNTLKKWIASLRSQRRTIQGLFLLALLPLSSAHAQTQAAQGFTLAYIRTGEAALDTQSQRGLEVLARVLDDRTSIAPQGVTGVDPARDILVFFPLLYWPVSPTTPPLSTKAVENLQSYLDHGGTIFVNARGTQDLRTALQGLNIPPLVPLPAHHVLTKSFYLLKNLSSQDFWVEQQSVGGRDGVSSIIIGAQDPAGIWAETDPSNITREQELSLRTGVNLVMYALTGNYKADQIHVSHILERLGE